MSVVSTSNEHYWNRVLNDDIQALEKLYKDYYPGLFSYANKIVNDRAVAEDAVQDTFLYIWQHRARIGKIDSLNYYFFKSVRNACLSTIKKKNNFKTIDEAMSNNQMYIHPDELVLNDTSDQVKRELKHALDSLSARQREIIFLKFYNNLDYDEICALLKINYQSAVNHVYKAIQRLRKLEAFRNMEQWKK